MIMTMKFKPTLTFGVMKRYFVKDADVSLHDIG